MRLAVKFLLVLCVVSSCSKQSDNLKIGAILPLTGDYANYGLANKRAIELAVLEINERGGLKGKKVEVIFEDDQAKPQAGVSAATKLIQVDRVPAIIGAVPSSVTLAIAPIVESHKVVLLSPASSSPKITSAGDYIFRNYPSDVLEGKLVAEFALKNGYDNSCIYTINNEYGVGLNSVFRESYEKLGGKVLSNDSYQEGTKDFRPTLSRIKRLKPKSIFIVGYGREMGTMIRQARELGIETQFLSTVNFYDEESIKAGGEYVEGVIFSSPVFDPTSDDPNVKSFVQRFRARYQSDPDVWSAHGYDAMELLAYAINKEGFSSDDIKRGLYSIRDFPGVSGKTSFDENGDVEKAARFLTVKQGKFVPLQDTISAHGRSN